MCFEWFIKIVNLYLKCGVDKCQLIDVVPEIDVVQRHLFLAQDLGTNFTQNTTTTCFVI